MRSEIVETGVYESRSAYAWQKYFIAVTAAYRDIRTLPCLTAINPDDDERPNRRLSADLIHFLVDVERATKKALGTDPGQFERWYKLVMEEQDDVPDAYHIRTRCGRVYQQRKLMPGKYFHSIKQGRADRRTT